MIKKNCAQRAEILTYVAIFCVMLLCNWFTPYLADDYSYMYSFATDERITSIFQIFPSMAAHAETVNGRLVPHFLVQLFLMFSKKIFNVVNAMMFTALVFLLCRIGRGREGGKYASIHALAVFSALWLYTPSFGQVYLWLDGAVNYLWPLVFALLFLLPYLQSFLQDKPVTGIWRWLLPVGSLLMGACSENTSASAIGMAVLLVLLECLLQKKKLDWHKLLCIFLAVVGYVTIFLAPGQWENKSVELTDGVFWDNLKNAVLMYKRFIPLLSVVAVLAVLHLCSNTDRKLLWVAAVLVAGSLCANFMMAVARVYPLRSALPVCALLVAAIAVLASGLRGQYKRLLLVLAALLMLNTSFQLYIGISDILDTCQQARENEAHFSWCHAVGKDHTLAPVIVYETQYSPAYGLRYLSGDGTWPNNYISRYYGLDYIVGYEK